MKEKELRSFAKCANCPNKIMTTGSIFFWVVSVESYSLCQRNIIRHSGLEQFLGGSVQLAQIMGPDEDLATQVKDKIRVMVCDDCATKPLTIAELSG